MQFYQSFPLSLGGHTSSVTGGASKEDVRQKVVLDMNKVNGAGSGKPVEVNDLTNPARPVVKARPP